MVKDVIAYNGAELIRCPKLKYDQVEEENSVQQAVKSSIIRVHGVNLVKIC